MTYVIARASCLIMASALYVFSHAVVWQQAALR